MPFLGSSSVDYRRLLSSLTDSFCSSGDHIDQILFNFDLFVCPVLDP